MEKELKLFNYLVKRSVELENELININNLINQDRLCFTARLPIIEEINDLKDYLSLFNVSLKHKSNEETA